VRGAIRTSLLVFTRPCLRHAAEYARADQFHKNSNVINKRNVQVIGPSSPERADEEGDVP
jgi:hypothetical protein